MHLNFSSRSILLALILLSTGCAPIRDHYESLRMLESAQAHYESGDFEAAALDSTRAIELAGDINEAHQVRAWAYIRLNRFEEAMDDIDKVLRVNPKAVNARFARAFLRLQHKNYEGALEDARFVLSKEPEVMDAYLIRGEAQAKLGSVEEAIDGYQKLLSLSYSDYRIYNNLARLLAFTEDEEIQDLEAAQTYAEKSIKFSRKQNPQPLETLALIYAQKGELENAITLQRQAVEVATDLAQKSGLNRNLLLLKQQWRQQQRQSLRRE